MLITAASKLLVVVLPLLAAGAPGQVPLGLRESLTQQSAHAASDVIDLTKYTIGEILAYTLEHAHDEDRHTPPLKKLAYIVNRTESIKKYLSDSDVSITLFAPDDEALQFPGHHDHDHDHEHGPRHGPEDRDGDDDGDEAHKLMIHNHPFKQVAAEVDGLEHTDKDHGNDQDEEKKREFIRKIVTAILHYHISPHKLSFEEIRDKSTIGTTLNQTKDTDVSFRIRASPRLDFLPPPPNYGVALNFYSRIRRGPALLAKNGIIHLISAPLLPPLTPLDQLFLFPNVFSTLTSAIQQAELDRAIAPWLHEHKDEKSDWLSSLLVDENEPADQPSSIAMSVLEELVNEVKALLPSKDQFKAFPFTIFAPSNGAFAKIPFKIRLFLFSPFGRPILKKVLAFHVVPQHLFHTDYQLDATRSSAAGLVSEATIGRVPAWLVADHELPAKVTSFAGFPSPPHGPPHGPHPPSRPEPPRRKPEEPHHPGDGHHGKVDVSTYKLPTLLGNAKNETLTVKVYEYRLGFGKGPLVRRIGVGNYEQEEKDFSSVFVADGVAWGGAVHVVGSLIRPPWHPHHDDGDHHSQARSAGHLKSVDALKYYERLWA